MALWLKKAMHYYHRYLILPTVARFSVVWLTCTFYFYFICVLPFFVVQFYWLLTTAVVLLPFCGCAFCLPAALSGYLRSFSTFCRTDSCFPCAARIYATTPPAALITHLLCYAATWRREAGYTTPAVTGTHTTTFLRVTRATGSQLWRRRWFGYFGCYLPFLPWFFFSLQLPYHTCIYSTTHGRTDVPTYSGCIRMTAFCHTEKQFIAYRFA